MALTCLFSILLVLLLLVAVQAEGTNNPWGVSPSARAAAAKSSSPTTAATGATTATTATTAATTATAATAATSTTPHYVQEHQQEEQGNNDVDEYTKLVVVLDILFGGFRSGNHLWG
eukprot:CAMPEP_0118705890 /NCGR_PEP_ID=MMETSP0800-20121206/20184_1 /TAXON_ID=210618 ORGANISM="Striatella unipunctata, Strain CCMP2910" /NCGR_SAMPLE_ID=MMETSP0800 /ASSEMBLY_ACC=CAM_ASM_000638 /LENGTH=116 /DNA_ID=CAMNT_0006608225 /DNA_START=23 /DNA_END=373 /DNA_ORIENTATION=-